MLNFLEIFQGHYVKDLDVLGRNLDRVAIIDNSVEAVGFQLHNAVLIDDFLGDTSDRRLLDMVHFLNVFEDEEDSREAVSRFYQSL